MTIVPSQGGVHRSARVQEEPRRCCRKQGLPGNCPLAWTISQHVTLAKVTSGTFRVVNKIELQN